MLRKSESGPSKWPDRDRLAARISFTAPVIAPQRAPYVRRPRLSWHEQIKAPLVDHRRVVVVALAGLGDAGPAPARLRAFIAVLPMKNLSGIGKLAATASPDDQRRTGWRQSIPCLW